MNWATSLRKEISRRAKEYADKNNIPYYLSLGSSPTVMFKSYEGGTLHGNFLPSSYKAILGDRYWSLRLKKPHQQPKALPLEKSAQANELDSSNSSDALLMNIFCNPKALKSASLAKLFHQEKLTRPEFGIQGRVPFRTGKKDATEIDMRLGSLFIEAKFTEADFTDKAKVHVERYHDFKEVFEPSALPQNNDAYFNYQLIRNVLAAYAHGAAFFLICDARRPDLLRSLWNVISCIKPVQLRLRCKFLLWQEISAALNGKLQEFLEEKYGIAMRE
jgi:hypothetical protein